MSYTRRVEEIGPGEKFSKLGTEFTEPDLVSFLSYGLECRIIRHPTLLSLCGYVRVPATNHFFGKHYNDPSLESVCVHGGLTFAGNSLPEEPTKPGEYEAHGGFDMANRGWWFGFDCGHYLDIVPGLEVYTHFRRFVPRSASLPEATYKPIEYVTEHCELLASQLAFGSP